MTRKIPLTLALAALVGFAAPTLAAEPHAGHDPQAAASTTAPKAAPSKHAKKAAKGRSHAKASKAHASKATATKAAPASTTTQPAAK